MGTVPPCIAEANSSMASGPQGVSRMGRDARGTASDCRDRDSQIVGIIRPVASQPPTPCDMEEDTGTRRRI